MAIAREDLAYPFRIDPASQQTAQIGYPAHVEQMIRQVLLTSPGERANLPQFGAGLRSLVFAPDADPLAATVKLRVTQALNQWLGGVVTVVDIATAAGTSGTVTEPGTLQVTITYTLVETQTTQAVTVAIT
jgi:phage baseplate assembly protein W